MSSAPDKSHQSSKSAATPTPQTDDQPSSVSQPPSSAETAMDQPLDSPLTAVPPTPPNSSETMSSTDTSSSTQDTPIDSVPPAAAEAPALTAPNPVSSPSAGEESDHQSMAMRQQPIPPASEPMQYRAIGLVRGKYVASEEQFTRGELVTDDGVSIGAVLLGRVMSLVKKHLDLEQPHLWVVYPRTRDKGAGTLHVQIVGVWEPEKLSRINESEESNESPTDTSQVTHEAVDDESSVDDEPSTEDSTLPPIPASELDDKYFSVRGEIIYQDLEEERLLVKIRRAPRPGTDESKAFKVLLKGKLEGKAVGYFWDLHIQREGDELVVKEGTMIGAVPPQKRSKAERERDRGGPRRRRPMGAGGGGARKRWNGPPRDGQQRPSRPSGDRPNASPRGATSKPVIKRRNNPEKSEG